jgi:hypothetical protein
MKTLKIFLTLVVVALLGSCSTSRIASPGVYEDDLYYVPGSTSSAQSQFTEVPTLDKETKKAYNRDFNDKVNDYERSDRARNQEDLRDFTEIQREYAGILSSDTITEIDTLLYYDDETGYWVDGFEGSEMDRDYAERIIRFHGPFSGIPYWSPLYTEVVYMNNWGWNVYVDGNYAYAFPSWSNPWYYSHSPRWSMSMNWGWGSWGYGYPYYSYGYYGYYSPWYGWGYDPWYNPHHHHYAHHNDGYYGNNNYNYAPRQSFSNYSGVNPSTNQGNAGVRPNRRVLDSNAENLKAGTNTGVTGRPARTSSYSNTNPQSPSGKPNVNRRVNVGENKSATERPTRSSYVPRYSETSSPTRPQYNSQGYTRPSGNVQNNGTQGTSAPRREYSQPAKSSNPSGYSRPASTSPSRGTGVTTAPSKPAKSSGSSAPARSSGSSERYTPSSSSVSGSSHTPSSSSSSGSSGSSSGSSSRSSGSPRR